MFKRSRVGAAVVAALGGIGAVGVLPAFGQQAEVSRVEVTGSAIRRIDAESALPVQVLNAEEIRRTGATSVADLLQRLPAVQGGAGESAAVGGATFGFTGVSIHNVGDTRTLVLLNGRRLANFGGQALTGFAAGFDLNSLPLSAIERVELLTDGASAIYGADAIAGVVNFITKRDITDGDASVGYSAPSGGAEEFRASVTKGFGSLAEDGFNIIGTLSYDRRNKLDATERDYAKSAEIKFSRDGKQYRVQQVTARTIPATVLDDNGNLVNPYLIQTGACAPRSFRVTDGSDDFCAFDFVGDLEIYPERERTSAMLSGTLRAGSHDLFADVLWSRTNSVSRIAPVPGGLPVAAGSEFHDQYLKPVGINNSTTAFYRVADLGKRTSDDTADYYDIAIGSRGSFGTWDYEASYSRSESDVQGDISGYPGALALSRLTRAGVVNPFVLPGEQTPVAQQALDGINYVGYWDGGKSTLDSLQASASTEIAKVSAGSVMLAVGGNLSREKFEKKPSLFAQAKLSDPVAGTLCEDAGGSGPCDQRFGDAAAIVPYGADRTFWGLFGEVLYPVTKTIEVSGALRYDDYEDFGGQATGKAGFRWAAAPTVLVRGSVGTGFHAPTVPQLSASPQSFGVTSGSYACTPELQAQADRLNAQCQPGTLQYDVVAGGNADLKPEESQQATLGIRLEPTRSFSFGVDYWWLKIENAFGQVSEGVPFANPAQYPGSWTTAQDIATGITYLALNQGNLNLGNEYYSGLDFDVVGRTKFADVNVVSQLLATYMIFSKRQLSIDGPYYSDLGNMNTEELGTASFRWKGRWTNTALVGAWAHTLAINFQSGYRDGLTTVEVLDSDGNVTGTEDLRLDIGSFVTFDWQTQWRVAKNFNVAVGALNLFNKEPPLAISGDGLNRGQQFGYDDRYFDSRGRTWYINASFLF